MQLEFDSTFIFKYSSLTQQTLLGLQIIEFEIRYQILQLMQDPSRNDDDPFEHLAAGHKKMADLQADFHRRYLSQVEKNQLELKEILLRRNNIDKEKIQTGNRLYSAQQQLAENQMSYEKTYENFNVIQRIRIESEQRLEQINESYSVKKQQVIALRDNVAKAQKQLQNFMRNYHEIGAYNIQLKSDIAVTRTETFTAEKAVVNLEYVKKKQDFLIDSMNEEIKRLEQQKNILAAQFITQKQETEEAKKVLRQAQVQMASIKSSKKNLLQRWQKSLFVMKKMDQTLQHQNQAYKKQKEELILLQTQYSGLKSDIRKQDAKTEKITTQSLRLGNQKNSLEIKQKQLKVSQQNILMQLSVLKSSLNNTQEEIRKVELQRKQVDQEMNLIQTNIMKLHTETKKLLEELVNQKGEHTAIQKTASNLMKQATITQLQCEEKQVELEGLLNEIARVKIDQLNTKSQIEILESKKNEVIKERVEKQVQVATYQIQIREGHDLNEKKQHQVGRLNKLHDELVSSANDESKSPLENKHQNLLRETEQFQQTCNELYRNWIKKQTTLVHNNNRLQELNEDVSALETKKTILQQKKARLNDDYKKFEKDINIIKINLKGLQQEMKKLNDGLADRGDKRQKLQNQNFNIESEFGEKLKELQGESVRLQMGIDRLREQKAELLSQIIECEKHIVLWERKHHLEKQMQDALDPNVGQAQIQDLKKQIHRMQLKYQSIQKAQSQIQVELLRASRKQEAIQNKYAKRPSQGNNAKEPANKHQFQDIMKDHKQKYQKAVKNIKALSQKNAKSIEDREKLNKMSIDAQQQLREKQMGNHNAELDLLYIKNQRQIQTLKAFSTKATTNYLSQMANRQRRLEFQEPVLRQKLSQLQQKNNIICQCIDEVAEKFPEYRNILSVLSQARQINHVLI